MSATFIFRAAWCAAIAASVAIGAAAQQSQNAPPAPDQTQAERDARIGKPVRVFMTDGQRLDGVLVEERDEAIVLRIGGLDTTLRREHIDRIVVERPAIERYRAMRGLIDDDDADRLLILIDWMRAEGLLDEARREVLAVLEHEPQNGDALRLRKLIDEQIELRSRATEGGGVRPVIPPREPARDIRRPVAGEFPLLSPEQVNLLKVYEVDLDDPPRLLIERDTIDALIQGNRGRAGIPLREAEDQAFRRLPPEEILGAMFEVRARELYPEVGVIDLPLSIRLFRDHVNSTWLVNRCGTTACHGGLEAGDFMLYNRAPTSERAVATNLLILERYRTPSGAPLIDYLRPEQSLLLQLALRPQLSAYPHPEVRGYKPVFLSTRSRRYAQAIQWIETMHRPRPEYPIEFAPPTPADFLDEQGVGDGQEPPDR